MEFCYPCQDSEPYHLCIYRDKEEIPFAPDGNAPLISDSVEEVKGISYPFWDLKCVRKTVNVPYELDEMSRNSLRREIVHEAKTLHLASHYHVVRLIHTYAEDVDGSILKYAIIMDRADTSLYAHLGRGATPSLQWFGCLISVVQHIHSMGIRHRDIKPSNILIKGNRVLLADFGISQMGLGKTVPTTYQGRNASRTRQYCAPEVDRGSTRGRSADIFSLGAVFLEMLVALSSPNRLKELNNVLKNSTESTFSYAKNIDGVHEWMEESFHPTGWQIDFLIICRTMLESSREKRPSAKEVKTFFHHEFIICTCAKNLPRTLTEKLIDVCKEGSKEEVESLLNQGADPSISGAIHYAANRGSVDIVQVLLNAHVPVNCTNPVGQTALHCAARNGYLHVVQQLLDNEANVNAKDENEQTALHGAAAQGHVSIVILLLNANADTSAEDLDGQTAYDFANRRNHTVVKHLLASHVEKHK